LRIWGDVNPSAAWKAVDVPVLVAYGTSDLVATIADQSHLAAIISAFHPGHAAVEPIAGMDHALNKATTMDVSFNRHATGEFEPTILAAIVRWIDRGDPGSKLV
jgi:hypothetical protein